MCVTKILPIWKFSLINDDIITGILMQPIIFTMVATPVDVSFSFIIIIIVLDYYLFWSKHWCLFWIHGSVYSAVRLIIISACSCKPNSLSYAMYAYNSIGSSYNNNITQYNISAWFTFWLLLLGQWCTLGVARDLSWVALFARERPLALSRLVLPWNLCYKFESFNKMLVVSQVSAFGCSSISLTLTWVFIVLGARWL